MTKTASEIEMHVRRMDLALLDLRRRNGRLAVLLGEGGLRGHWPLPNVPTSFHVLDEMVRAAVRWSDDKAEDSELWACVRAYVEYWDDVAAGRGRGVA